jgi:hypothetical protein
MLLLCFEGPVPPSPSVLLVVDFFFPHPVFWVPGTLEWDRRPRPSAPDIPMLIMTGTCYIAHFVGEDCETIH